MSRIFVLNFANKKLTLDDREYRNILDEFCDEVENNIGGQLVSDRTNETIRLLNKTYNRKLEETFRFRPVRFITTEGEMEYYYFDIKYLISEFRYDYNVVYFEFYVDSSIYGGIMDSEINLMEKRILC